MTEAAAIVQRVWNYCHVLRDDGVSYGDYLEQLTYLLFLKMAEERAEIGRPNLIPEQYRWPTLVARRGVELEDHYRELGAGLIPTIFRKAQNRITDPAKLERLVSLINKENWSGLDIDAKAEIYERLLEKNAQDVKSGAGQYFTPRPLIRAMVEVMRPRPGQLIADPAAGTGGFLLAAHDYIRQHHRLDRDQRRQLNHEALQGWEIVENAARLCVMNLYLYGIGLNGADSPVHVDDSLRSAPGERFDLVLTNPPSAKRAA